MTRPITGPAGFVSLLLRDLSLPGLLTVANVARAQGRHLLADAAIAELARRAS